MYRLFNGMTLVMGECVECGHYQPGEIQSSEVVSPLADRCVKCDNELFVVSDESERERVSISETSIGLAVGD